MKIIKSIFITAVCLSGIIFSFPSLAVNLPYVMNGGAEATVYEKILGNISNLLYSEIDSYETVTSNAQRYMEAVNPDGSWDDLTYTGDKISTAHLDRLKTMALVYTNSQSDLHEDEVLHIAIVKGLQCWYDKDADHWNWFYDQIAYPQRVGEILVLMRNGVQQLPAALENALLARMKNKGGAPDQGGSQGTGANKMNIALHWIYRGCLAKDPTVLNKGIQQALFPLSFTVGEGLQPDFSYLQHGPQLYIGGYGWDIINVATRVALYIDGVSYAQDNGNLDNLSKFVRHTYLRVIRGQNYLFNAIGRSIARPRAVSQADFVNLLERMKAIDPSNASVYRSAIARLNNSQPANSGVEAAHTHYYRADYTLQTKPGYTVELRTVSDRTFRNENGNGENLEGYFLSDGATSIAVTGTEYYDVFPVWDWSMIPGVTARKGTMVRPRQWGTYGTTSFVGGVSDSIRGVSVYDLDNNSTTAKKSWFFFDDEVVCLGAGIHATGTEEVVTTLNQCLLQSNVITSTVGNVVQTYSNGNFGSDYDNNLEWVIQGNVGYVLPHGGDVGLRAKEQTGKWSTINSGRFDADVTKDVFTLWLKHGVAPTNAKYAYIIVPNVQDTSQIQDYLAKDNVQILKNEADIQAVRHKELNLYGFVFHDTTSLFDYGDIQIEVSDPCLLMVHPLPSGELRLHVADPTKSLARVSIKMTWPRFTERIEVHVDLELPTTVETAGKSVVAYITNHRL
ncbi:polysaccharide lyase 8 family protein [Sphingobacterium wenxiniae]|uniref:Chondroitin AC lyase n=1 Tax=Sphingobacterium wenxiniae TaxID=683125 RepID=A0A1I6R510_9SPHI|nr:polysaccharide lyase 8 family protein [Sphingobacterium wenxiniae]SFS59578.1 chondroitin AC lyase [Sphingobacterium wenxiniae]